MSIDSIAGHRIITFLAKHIALRDMPKHVNPTKKQIQEFCKLLETHLLEATERGSSVEIAYAILTKDVVVPEYGDTVIDARYVGAKFFANYTERGF